MFRKKPEPKLLPAPAAPSADADIEASLAALSDQVKRRNEGMGRIMADLFAVQTRLGLTKQRLMDQVALACAEIDRDERQISEILFCLNNGDQELPPAVSNGAMQVEAIEQQPVQAIGFTVRA